MGHKEGVGIESYTKLKLILHTRHPEMTYRCLGQHSCRIFMYYSYSLYTNVPKSCIHTKAKHMHDNSFDWDTQLRCSQQLGYAKSGISGGVTAFPGLPDLAHPSETRGLISKPARRKESSSGRSGMSMRPSRFTCFSLEDCQIEVWQANSDGPKKAIRRSWTFQCEGRW